MLKYIYRILVLIALALTISFLAWLSTLHGTTGVLHVDSSLRLGFIVIIIALLLLGGLFYLRILLNRNQKAGLSKSLLILIIPLMVLEIIFPVSGFVYLNIPVVESLDIQYPQLLLNDSISSTGIANISVINYTSNPEKETLTWGTLENESSITENTVTRQHLFSLNDLKPVTEYHYKINNGPVYYFNTSEIYADSLHFAVSSDAHYGAGDNRPDLTAKMLREISNPSNNYGCFFSLGDLVNYGFSNAQWEDAFRGLTPSISEVPSVLIAGNHDTLFTGIKRYEYYCYPSGLSPQPGSALWHRYDFGSIHFLCLDIEWSAESFTNQQKAWFEEQLKSIPPDDWKIVMSHGFYYGSGSIVSGWKWYDNPETIGELTPLFEKYGVNLVFSGHDHQLELLQHSGVTYIITGGFGGILDPICTYKSPASLWYEGGQYGFTDVSIKGGQAEIVFRDPDNKILKTFNINK